MLKLPIVLICILFPFSFTFQTDEQVKTEESSQEKFEHFIKEYNRHYKDDDEKTLRYSYFVDNVKKADELNKNYEEAEFGITKFSDWSEDEFKQLLGTKPVLVDSEENIVLLQKFNEGPAPAAFDWREQDTVTSVKDQGMCGSCWAFSAVANIEGQYALKHHKLISFSEQEVVDCSKNNSGCFGGYPVTAFKDLSAGLMLETENEYSYIDNDEACKYKKDKGIAKVIGYNLINATNEVELKQALYESGPLSFIMNGDMLVHFKGGIFEGCIETIADHAMLIVGYGSGIIFLYFFYYKFLAFKLQSMSKL